MVVFDREWPSLLCAYLMVRTACAAIFLELFLKNFNLQAYPHPPVLSSYLEENDSMKKEPHDKPSDLENFLDKVQRELYGCVKEESLLKISSKLKSQYYERLQDPNCMLPSFNYRLPTGNESGKFVAVDLGGSNLRVANVLLSGRSDREPESKVLNLKSFKITSSVKELSGHSFFDWIAERIEETFLEEDVTEKTVHIGISWSFPIEQTSHRNGLLLKMGKGFSAADAVLKQDLADLIQHSCQSRGINVRVDAITNDSSATLFAKAYSDNDTRFSLVLGTGINSTVYLPADLFTLSKFGVRPSNRHASAQHILVNTEISMMGKDVLPETKWDSELKSQHPNPDFQPFEHFVSGRYLGEIIRLILIDGIRTAGLFGGIIPPSLREAYSLDTETISQIECNQISTEEKAYQVFWEKHPSVVAPTKRDILALRSISSNVIHRASGLVSAGIYAIWQLRNELDCFTDRECARSVVACTGSVIERYPGFRAACQEHLDFLTQANGGIKGAVQLVCAIDSSLVGAAVASAVALSQ